MPTIVSIELGGTGANSAAAARAALGVSSSVDANAAYEQANTARNTANDAYSQANTARSDANTTFATINTTFGTVNTGISTANTQANDARNQANSAYAQANLAYAAANNGNLLLGGVITGTLNVTQDIIVGGNVYLEGNTTFINVATYAVEDSLIYLASNNQLTDSVDIGFMGGKNTGGTYSHTGLARDATDAKWKLFDGLPEEGHVGNVVDFTNTYLATLVANVEANTLSVVNGVSGNVNFDSGTLFVDSVANKVGIGTTNSFGILSLYGSNPDLVIQSNSGTSDRWRFRANDNDQRFSLVNDVSGYGEVFTILRAGNVGIGTTNPSSKLHILDSTGPVFRMVRTSNRFDVEVDNNAMGFVSRDSATANAYFSGFAGVGIGTASPSQKLHVVGNAFVTPIGGWTTGGVATQFFGDIYGSIKYDYNTTNFLISSYGSFSVATNGTLPTTRLTIDASGNVGIGTTSPAYRVQINRTEPDALGIFRALDVGAVGAAGTYIDLGALSGSTATAGARIVGVLNNPATSGYITFNTLNSSTMGERMIITAAGNVGIGTTNPGSPLHVVTGSADSNGFNFETTGSSGKTFFAVHKLGFIRVRSSDTNGAAIHFWDNAGTKRAELSIGNDSKINWYSDALTSTWLTFDGGNGRVGIGLTNPISKTHIDLSSGVNGLLIDATYAGGSGGESVTSTAANTIYNAIFRSAYGTNAATVSNAGHKWGVLFTGYNGSAIGASQLQKSAGVFAVSEDPGAGYNRTVGLSLWTAPFDANITEKVRITGPGNVGIGTANPAAKLDIYPGGADLGVGANGIRVQRPASYGQYGYLEYLISSDITVLGSLYTGGGASSFGQIYLRQHSSTTSRDSLVINAIGNVGIGTVTPSSRLHLWDTNNNAVGTSTFWNFNFVGQEITNASATANTVAGIAFVGGSGRNSVSAIGNIQESSSLGALAFFTGGQGVSGGTVPERMRITSAGNVGIGTTTNSTTGGFTNTRVLIKQIADGVGGGGLQIEQNSNDNVAFFGFTGSAFRIGTSYRIAGSYQPIHFYPGNSLAIAMDTGGNVGIGTTSPQSKLEVATSSGDFSHFGATSTGSGQFTGITLGYRENNSLYRKTAIVQEQIGDNSARGHLHLLVDIANDAGSVVLGDSKLMIHATTGNIGIGTTNPSQKLDVVGNIKTSGTMGANGTIDLAADGGAGYVASRLILRTHDNYRGTGIFMVGETSAVSNNTFFIGTPYTAHSAGIYIRYTANNYQTDYQSSAYTAAGTTLMHLAPGGAVTIPGSLSKGSGSFKIDHPLPEKANSHFLVHSFIEGPQADLIYSGRVQLQNGSATINIDTHSNMTEGTFIVLCRDIRCFTTNETSWDAVRGSVSGNILTIECQNPTSNATVSWMVIGERQDKHMLETEWTDESGKVIVEPEKPATEILLPPEEQPELQN